jgi:cell division protein FtsI (penicillin-binding protein 3)
MMFNVVDKKWGTGHRIKDSLLTMAGKTGTCQVDYTTDSVQYVSSFVGYFPAEKPQYSCIVVIHRPDKTKGYYGATVAAPVFKTIAKKIFNDIPKQIPLEASSLTDLIENTRSQGDLSVPNLTGLSEEEAIKKSQELGLKVLINGKGTVIEQRPEAGAKISNNQQVILKLS